MFLPRTQLTHLVIWLEDEPEHCCSPCSQTTSRQSDCITAVFSSACVRHFKLHRFLQVRTRHGRLDALDSSVGPAYIVPPWACPFSILGRHGLSAEVQKDNEVLHPFHQILIRWLQINLSMRGWVSCRVSCRVRVFMCGSPSILPIGT